MTHEGGIKVLAVDDSPDKLELMTLLLKKAGYSVFSASDGREAFEIAKEQRPHLVISDVMMPHVSGIELCRKLRADAQLCSVRVLLVSAMRADDSSAVEGLQAGADDYLEAPYDPMRLIAMVARLAERARFEERLLHNALHDALTELPNRALFMNRLGNAVERARRHVGVSFAVLFIDLDRFKSVNDSRGHAAGDRLLVEAGRRLRDCVRAGDTAARLGGDEFTLLLEDFTGAVDVLATAERIAERLALPYRLDGQEIFTGASVGVSLCGHDCGPPEEILRDADTAMRRAKSLGGGRVQLFDAELHARAASLLRLETELRRAADRGEFVVYYQPIISLETRRVFGFEALVRWQHPTRGLIHPDEFIPAAEETGLVTRIDRWVLGEACRQARLWREHSPRGASPSVSVNLSAKSFMLPDLAEQVARVLAETGLGPESLNLEITENLLLSDTDAVKSVLARLKAMGVGLHLDDFGTGYSSLSYLHRFPIDALKIDRSFVGRIGPDGENLEIARAVVMLAHGLGMEVIAEGVEEEHQSAQLRALGCEYGQGYLFAMPVGGEEIRPRINLVGERVKTARPTAQHRTARARASRSG